VNPQSTTSRRRPPGGPASGLHRLLPRRLHRRLTAAAAVAFALAAALTSALTTTPAAAQGTTAPGTTAQPAPPTGDPFPPPIHQTRIVASYDPETRLITGIERLRWRNDSGLDLDELVFHHYLNAFANEGSTFMRGSGGQLRGVAFSKRDWGWIEVDSFTLADGTDLAPAEEYVTATASGTNPDDRTVARYPLPRPVPAGGWIELEIAFTAKLPEIFARTGAHGDYVLAGQWYPKIAVFEEAGEGGATEPGWNAHPVPPPQRVLRRLRRLRRHPHPAGAVPREDRRHRPPGRRERRRRAGDRALRAARRPRLRLDRPPGLPGGARPLRPGDRRAGRAARARSPRLLGVDEAELALTPVDLELFIQPANAAQAGRYLAAAKAAIRGFGLRLGPTPTPRSPWSTRRWAPTARRAWSTRPSSPSAPIRCSPSRRSDHLLFPEIVTVHEFGHQYFQGMIASNEFEESWIDEGITSYYENVVMEEAFGRHAARFLGLEMPLWEATRTSGHWPAAGIRTRLPPPPGASSTAAATATTATRGRRWCCATSKGCSAPRPSTARCALLPAPPLRPSDHGGLRALDRGIGGRRPRVVLQPGAALDADARLRRAHGDQPARDATEGGVLGRRRTARAGRR
jgi:hypothetical protein